MEQTVLQKQATQKQSHDAHSKQREFVIGQQVLARNFRGLRWIQGTTFERRGPLSYWVQTHSNKVWSRHVDHLLEAGGSSTEAAIQPKVSFDWNAVLTKDATTNTECEFQQEISTSDTLPLSSPAPPISNTGSKHVTPPSTPTVRRYPRRENRQPPKRFGFEE